MSPKKSLHHPAWKSVRAVLASTCLAAASSQLANAESLINRVPADALWMYSVSDAAKQRGYLAKTPLGQVWTDPAMATFKEQGLRRLNALAAEVHKTYGFKFAELGHVFAGELVVAAMPSGKDGSPAKPSVVALARTTPAKGAPVVAALNRFLRDQRPDLYEAVDIAGHQWTTAKDSGGAALWGVRNDVFYFVAGPDPATTLPALLRDNPRPIAALKTFDRKLHAASGLFGFVNVAGLRPRAESTDTERAELKATGFGNVESLSCGLRWHAATATHSLRAHVAFDGPRDGFVSLLGPRRLPTGALKSVSSKATQVFACELAVDGILEVIRTVERATRTAVDDSLATGLAAIKQTYGVDVEALLATGLGSSVIVSQGQTAGGNALMPMPGLRSISASVDVRDKQLVAAALGVLNKRLTEIAAQNQGGPGIRLETMPVGDATLQYVSFQGNPMAVYFSPAWALSGDRLYVALHPEAVVQATKPATTSIVTDPAFAAEWRRASKAGAWSLQWSRPKTVMPSFAALPMMVPMMMQSFVQARKRAGSPTTTPANATPPSTAKVRLPATAEEWIGLIDWTFAPAALSRPIVQTSAPHWFATTVDGGIRIDGRASLGVPDLSAGGISTVGLLSAIAIPSFVKARQSAQQNACINNLRLLDSAKDQWAIRNNKLAEDTVDMAPLVEAGYIKREPACPAGGAYTLGTFAEDPTCSKGGTHRLAK